MPTLDIPEKEWQKRVTDLCDWLGLLWYHPNDSRRDKAGFPDLVIVGPGGVIFAELKRRSGRMSASQIRWQETLLMAGARAYVWRPDDWALVQSELKRISVGHNGVQRRA